MEGVPGYELKSFVISVSLFIKEDKRYTLFTYRVSYFILKFYKQKVYK